jgi:hypothetical protein
MDHKFYGMSDVFAGRDANDQHGFTTGVSFEAQR